MGEQLEGRLVKGPCKPKGGGTWPSTFHLLILIVRHVPPFCVFLPEQMFFVCYASEI